MDFISGVCLPCGCSGSGSGSGSSGSGPTELRLPCCPTITIRCPVASTMHTPSMDVHNVRLLCDPSFNPSSPPTPPSDVLAACDGTAADTGIFYTVSWYLAIPDLSGFGCTPVNTYTGQFRLYLCCRDNHDGTHTPLAILRGAVAAPGGGTTTSLVTVPVQGDAFTGSCGGSNLTLTNGSLPAFTVGGITVGPVALVTTPYDPLATTTPCDGCDNPPCNGTGWGTYHFTVTDLSGAAPCVTGSGTATIVEPNVDGSGSYVSDSNPECTFSVYMSCAKELGLQQVPGVVVFGIATYYYSDSPYHLIQYGRLDETVVASDCPGCDITPAACMKVKIELTV